VNRKKKLTIAQDELYLLRKQVEAKFREYSVIQRKGLWGKSDKTAKQLHYLENQWKNKTLAAFNLQRDLQRGNYVHARATLKFNLFVANELNKNAWALDRISTRLCHAGISKWLGTHFSEANGLIAEYISYKVSAEYWESKYNLQKILHRISLRQILHLFTALEKLAQLEGVVSPDRLEEFADIFKVWGKHMMHTKCTAIPKEDAILFVNTFLSGLKKTDRYKTVFRFTRLVAILFR